MINVTRPSRSTRMKPLGAKSRAGCAPAARARPSGAGRRKLTSRPPPAALAFKKVRRERVRTLIEANSAQGFVPWAYASDQKLRSLSEDEPCTVRNEQPANAQNPKIAQ